MQRHLVLRLASPLIAFGGEAIDNLGVIRDFPALSMVTGLIANALGWDRSQAQEHNRLQARLRMGCVLAPGAQRVQDFQTAQLAKDDKGWTTWGTPEERAGGSGTYAGPHLRYRDYHADLCAWVALALVQIAKRLRGVLTKGRAQQAMQGVAQVGALAGVACMVACHPGG